MSTPSEPTDLPPFAIRPLVEADTPFVFNSWLKSFRDSRIVKSIPNTIYFSAHHAVIEKILKSPRAFGAVACNPEDSGQIYGYVIAEMLGPQILCFHWIYCKHPFRGFGLARGLEQRLIDEVNPNGGGIFYSHRTKSTDRLMERRHYIYNPYVLYR